MAVTTLVADSPAESVKQAIKSTSTCSNTTLLSLQGLLRGSLKSSSPDIESYAFKRDERSTNSRATTTSSRTIRGTTRSKTSAKATPLGLSADKDCARLSCHEKLALATEVFNTTLKALSDASKTEPASKRQPSQSPSKSKTSRRTHSTLVGSDNGVLATAECARLALSCLRVLKGESVSEGNGYPNIQLEQGACVLAGRFMSLGLNDLAYKELRGLKRRIQNYADGGRPTKDNQDDETGKERMSDFLTFTNLTNAKSLYGLLVTFQSNALRLISSEKRASTIQKVCPSLQLSSPSSPAKIIMAASESGSLPKDKAALQLQLLSNTVLSLSSCSDSPNGGRSPSSKEYLKPMTILTLQLLSLEIRCLGWQLSGHVCDEGKEMLDPLARYLGNFAQRSKEIEKSEFVAIYKIILQLHSAVAATKRKSSNLSKADPGSAIKITTTLGQLAQEANCYEEALKLYAEALTPLSLRQSLSLGTVRCKIASVYLQALKSGSRKFSEDSMSNALAEATSALGLSLKGSPGDLDELLVEAARLKKLLMSWFGDVVAKDNKGFEKNDTTTARVCEYLHGFIRFLRRYIGRQPSLESGSQEHEAFQKKASLSKNVALAAVDSALAVGKLSVMSLRPRWEDFLPISIDCHRILMTLQGTVDGDSKSEADNCGMGLVKMSNLFWSRYLKEKELGKVYSDLLPLLKQSTGLLSSCTSSQRSAGFAPLKFERLAHLYLEGHMGTESEKAFRQSIREHIDTGVLVQLTSDAASNRPYRSHQDPKSDGFALGRVLSAFLKMKTRHKDWRPQDVFDDDFLEREQRGFILEWQMGILAESHTPSCLGEYFRFTFSTLVFGLLDLYSPERNPIRRSRVILRALRFALEHPNVLDLATVRRLVDEGAKSYDYGRELNGDSSMKGFVTHIRNSLRLTLGFQNGYLKPYELSEVVSSWTSMARQCRDWAALESCVDDTEYWVLQMKALVDYTEVHGLWKLQLSVLELVLRIVELQEPGDLSDAIIILSRLTLQYCRLGHCKKAGGLLVRADQYTKYRSISSLANISCKLAQVEYILETEGDVERAASTFSAARALYEKARKYEDSASYSVQSKIAWERLVADAASIQSHLSCAQGSIAGALFFSKLSVRLNCRIWAKVEKLAQRKQEKSQQAGASFEVDSITEGIAKLDVSNDSLSDSSNHYSQGAPFWPHISSHHTCLLNLASLSAHYGLFQDAIYYGEQALKLNKTLPAGIRQVASQVQLGFHWILGGNLSEGQGLLEAAAETSKQLECSAELVSLQMSIAALHRAHGQYDNEYHALAVAEKLISEILTSEEVDSNSLSPSISDLEGRMNELRIQGHSRPQQRATTGRRTRAMTSSSRSGSKSVSKATEHAGVSQSRSRSLLQRKGDVLLQQASCSRALRNFDKATDLMSDARGLAVSSGSRVSLQIGETEHFLADAVRCLATHQVYCVLPESTISIPSLQLTVENEAESHSSKHAPTTKASTSQRRKAPVKSTTRSRVQKVTEDYPALLSKAGDCLNEVLTEATVLGSTIDSHRACQLMSRVSMLSHATASGDTAKWTQSPANVNEISRVGAFVREQTAINIDKQITDYSDPLLWPTCSISDGKPGADINLDFSKRYVDILPENWNVLSLSLSADNSEFVISKLRRNHSPFLLRLPLKRGNCDDEDDEQFTFDTGRDEMKEIIKLANESAHAARSQADKISKKEWWRNRESIDRRLEVLLQNIENLWIGGFRGVFTPLPQEDDGPFSQFASTFHCILDNNLPSRRKGGRAAGPRLTLHQNVLALFVGLRDLQSQEDPEEILIDLLYFVVDILQFQGERNAYDEIDFDLMVIETLNALRAYHNGVQKEQEEQPPHHTILILDKALHLFPWESLPCLQGFPVSRVPSLECLRDRVLQIRNKQTDSGTGKIVIGRTKGSYLLNPTGDLRTTQGTFEGKLTGMDRWSGIVNREPTEEEFRESLESKDLFLYFGHGSGAQYIRGRTIKRLSRCAVTFLMGCSSGTVTEAGEYEPYGTPMNYLHAGSPALVATLWDVTDKDIDRFAKSTFEQWGLMRGGREADDDDDDDDDVGGSSTSTTRKGRSKGGTSGSGRFAGQQEAVGLDEAVAKSRGSCLLKYLNGSAPVIYGVPVFLE